MHADLAVGMMTGAVDDLAVDVARVGIVFVNAYLLGKPGGSWILVDTGIPGFAMWIESAARERWGAGARPEAIVLTHGHFDHAGSALELATRWDVPIYVHPMEMPFVTGESDYPPQDPTMGGAIAFMSRFFPRGGQQFGERVRVLPADGGVPGMEEWRWIHTPGHTAGHVSLFRQRDRCLIAGDAFATTDLDSWHSIMTLEPQYDRPAATFTPDWISARRSIEALAALEPRIVGAGHGLPFYGAEATAGLHDLAAHLPLPAYGRYVAQPVRFDEHGVLAVPPPVPDPLPRTLAAWAVALGAWGVAGTRARRR